MFKNKPEMVNAPEGLSRYFFRKVRRFYIYLCTRDSILECNKEIWARRSFF